jgi:pantoate--beta-alanine ligase
MQVATTIAEVREKVKEWRAAGRKVGYVPTMGNLHDGHLGLCRLARKVTRHYIVSAFESPMQFGPNEDFDHHPRTPERDEQLLKSVNCDLLYRPDPHEIYPHGLLNSVHIEVPGYTDILCGAVRPGHFEALVSVINRLFNIVQPDIAVLGEKDFQQLVVIRRMVEELKMPINIVAAPAVRTADGLAMSSRNQYLTEDERRLAPRIYEELCKVTEAIEMGAGSLSEIMQLESKSRAALREDGFTVDYFTVASVHTLRKPGISESDLIVLCAARLGKARLIDNKRCTRL